MTGAPVGAEYFVHLLSMTSRLIVAAEDYGEKQSNDQLQREPPAIRCKLWLCSLQFLPLEAVCSFLFVLEIPDKDVFWPSTAFPMP